MPASTRKGATVVGELEDPRRREPPYVLPERDMLEGWLEFHRMTLFLKCDGLDDVARKARPVPSSLLSLHGLVRHMAEVERIWFRKALAEEDVGYLWITEENRDAEIAPLEGADWDADLAMWQAECEASRAVAAARSLEDTGSGRSEPCSLRWIYNHMIEEYSRHNGHADLIRELVDGAVGW
jgi:uncharacterized damage-inducible protein DinB